MYKFTSLKRNVADAVTSAVVGARDLAVDAKEGLERALVAKCLRAYSVKEQVATGGPQGVWKIYNAEARNQGELVSMCMLWVVWDVHVYVRSAVDTRFRLDDLIVCTLHLCRSSVFPSQCVAAGEKAATGFAQVRWERNLWVFIRRIQLFGANGVCCGVRGPKSKVWDNFLDQQRKNATNMLKVWASFPEY